MSFKFDSYSNEHIFLYDNKFKSIDFDNCEIELNELICQISKTKLISIVSKSGEIFYLGSSNIYQGQYIFNNVGGIIIKGNPKKNDYFIQINKLLNNVAENNSFIPYETNITSIQYLITEIFTIPFNDSTIKCLFKKINQIDNLLLLCHATSAGNYSLGEIKYQNISNISIENNFIIEEGYNYETILVDENGALISTVYPEILDFSKSDTLSIQIGVFGSLKEIKLNPDSDTSLNCKKSIKYMECSIPKSHFDNKKNGYYNIYHKNHLNEFAISYEAPLINVILPVEEPIQTEITPVESQESNILGIVLSIIGGIIVIVVILLLVFCFKKKDATEINEMFKDVKIDDDEEEDEDDICGSDKKVMIPLASNSNTKKI